MCASGDAVGRSRQSCWRSRGGHGGGHAQHGLRGPGGELRWALGSLRMERHRGRLREGGLCESRAGRRPKVAALRFSLQPNVMHWHWVFLGTR